ncbi:MAG: hypothetical protein M1813_003836 [Trichoglossum hirsutum]|nr:MAG: hypothetical protein M1813_003836 [Trichoglossum hirsutum]
MGFTPSPPSRLSPLSPDGFNGAPEDRSGYEYWTQQSTSRGPSMVIVTTQVAVPTQTVVGSGEVRETTKYVTSYATTFLVNPYESASTSAVATSTSSIHPVAAHSLNGTHLAAVVGFPVASVFVLFLLGFYLVRRRRQKKSEKEAQGEMAGITGLSQPPPLAKVSVCQPKDNSSHQSTPGLPPIDLEQPAPVAFPGEQSRNDPGRQPFSYAGYFSGIDTSVAESQHSPANGPSYRAMSPDPPPPYALRPESTISCSDSVRLAHPRPVNTAHRLSQGSIALHERPGVRSPFADPEDDDAESQAPSVDGDEVIRRRGTDDVSVISTVSDRDRETLVHQMV